MTLQTLLTFHYNLLSVKKIKIAFPVQASIMKVLLLIAVGLLAELCVSFQLEINATSMNRMTF